MVKTLTVLKDELEEGGHRGNYICSRISNRYTHVRIVYTEIARDTFVALVLSVPREK